MDRHLALMRRPQQLSAFRPFGVGGAGAGRGRPLRRGQQQCRTAHPRDRDPDGLKLVVLGGALGLALAVVATRLLGGLLFEINALDPLTFLGVPLVLGPAALLAAYLPARRASRVHPLTALRTD